MNILIPHSWLLEHLETQATPEQIRELLSLSGPSVERIYDREGESVYDIEVTTNRVDMMSVRGIAREAAVILTQFGLPSTLKPLKLPALKSFKPQIKSLQLPKVINDAKLCRRISCVVLANVARTSTPDWMAHRLQLIDQNVHDSVIDITNYVTHDLGHPCHAFDYDKLMANGGVIRVVKAPKGKQFMTLDGLSFETMGGEVVFENDNGEIIDLPSIKGTTNTSIDDQTKNVLLLLESIRPEMVRFASMTHAIRTVAAILMEKQADPHLIGEVLASGIGLYQDLCQAQVGSPVLDEFPSPEADRKINFDLSQVVRYLGVEIAPVTITQILSTLGCKVEKAGKTTLIVHPPTYRPDITIQADIIEEIARIYGYHNLPSQFMDTALPLKKPQDTDFAAEDKAKNLLAHLGWYELYTYSMVGIDIAQLSGYNIKDHVKIQNPLTSDREYMRRSIWPSLMEVYSKPQWQSVKGVFELAHVYHPDKKGLPIQELHLSLVSRQNYRQLMSDLTALAQVLHLNKMAIKMIGSESTGKSSAIGKIEVTDREGQAHPVGVVTQLAAGVYGVDFEWTKLLPYIRSYPDYHPQPHTDQIIEDLTLAFSRPALIGDILATISAVSPQIANVVFVSQFKDRYSFTITYQDPKINLDSQQVASLRSAIVQRLHQTFASELIGQLQDD